MNTRGTVTAASIIGGHTMLDLTLVSGETVTRVELLQPYGVTARPAIGTDVLVMEVGGRRGHLVAYMADSTGLRIPDLAYGEVGMRGPGGMVVFRADRIEVTGTLPIVLTSTVEVVVAAPVIRLGSASATKLVALDGDNAAGGTVISTATKVFAE